MSLDTRYTIPVARTVADLRSTVAAWRKDGARIALVPTMGALHHGHLSLVEHAAAHADRVVVSIFVNPTQFAPGEDFDDYPRTEEEDAKSLKSTQANLIFAPKAAEMYDPTFSTSIRVGEISEGLCATTRPNFFSGVATVVAKLLLQCLPDVAVFGEKDFQQLMVIRQMVQDLNIPVDILSAPTARESDGLATSSRNAYLTEVERNVAPKLHEALQIAAARIRDGGDVESVLKETISMLRGLGFEPIDYVECRSAEDLSPLNTFKTPARLLAAATLGKTRLIDNIEI